MIIAVFENDLIPLPSDLRELLPGLKVVTARVYRFGLKKCENIVLRCYTIYFDLF